MFWLQILNYETCVLKLYYTTTYCNKFFCCVCKLVIVLYLSSEVKPRSSAGLILSFVYLFSLTLERPLSVVRVELRVKIFPEKHIFVFFLK